MNYISYNKLYLFFAIVIFNTLIKETNTSACFKIASNNQAPNTPKLGFTVNTTVTAGSSNINKTVHNGDSMNLSLLLSTNHFREISINFNPDEAGSYLIFFWVKGYNISSRTPEKGYYLLGLYKNIYFQRGSNTVRLLRDANAYRHLRYPGDDLFVSGALKCTIRMYKQNDTITDNRNIDEFLMKNRCSRTSSGSTGQIDAYKTIPSPDSNDILQVTNSINEISFTLKRK